MIYKNTLYEQVVFSGIGIHTGQRVNLCLIPSSSGEIVFCRKDRGDLEIKLDSGKIKTKNSVYLSSKGCKIQTLEHLLAVLYMFGIGSLIVELDGDEIPITDGSALPLVRLIQKAGVKALVERRRILRIIKPAVIKEKEASVSVEPGADFSISYMIEYDHPLIQRQELSLSLSLKNFIREIAPARTFGFLKDVPALRAQKLALGGSLDNAVVLDKEGVMNKSLRYPDEFVRHKILDFIGDLSLLDAPLRGHFHAQKAGHRLHLRIVRYLLDNPDHCTYTEE